MYVITSFTRLWGSIQLVHKCTQQSNGILVVDSTLDQLIYCIIITYLQDDSISQDYISFVRNIFYMANLNAYIHN